MNRPFSIVVTIGLTVIPLRGLSQSVVDSTLAEWTESVLDETAAGESVSAHLSEELNKLLSSPLDLNRADADRLAEIPGISPLLAEKIIRLRKTTGRISAVSDLRSIRGCTSAVIERIRPFVHAGEGGKERAVEISQTWMRRMDVGAGFRSHDSVRAYAGTPVRLTTRARLLLPSGWAVAWMTDKDPGEASGLQKVLFRSRFDHTSWALSRRATGVVRMLVIGDFAVRAGTGLLLWTDAGMQILADPVLDPLRFGNGLRTAVSASESAGLRGAAVGLRPSARIRLTLFASLRRVDARLEGHAEDDRYNVHLLTSGLHRTETERLRQNAAKEQTAGFVLSTRNSVGMLGIAGFFRKLTPESIIPSELSGNQIADPLAPYGLGTFTRITAGIMTAQGEIALMRNGGTSVAIAAMFPFSESLSASLLVRRFGRSGLSRFGNSFSRTSRARHERGIYSGLVYQASRTLRFSSYADLFHVVQSVGRTMRPARGYRTRILGTIKPMSRMEFSTELRGVREETAARFADSRGLEQRGVGYRSRLLWRISASLPLSRSWQVRCRFEQASEGSPENRAGKGHLVFADIRWQPGRRIALSARTVHFHDGHSSVRLYAAESDLPYAFSLASFSGIGVRTYLRLKISAGRLAIWAKWSVTRRFDVDQMGTGNDLLSGNQMRELRLQARLVL